MSDGLRAKVRDAYSAAALSPGDGHPFPVGRRFAEELGYPEELLDSLPSASVDAFAGVANLSASAEIQPGAVVLDLGCGAGLDSLIAARRTGPSGHVLGIDFSGPMLRRAREGANSSGIGNVIFCQANAEALPVSNNSVDVALVNGIFNLNPARDGIFRELARVIRPGGEVYSAELVLTAALPDSTRDNPSDWFA